MPGQPLPAGWSELSLTDGGRSELTLRLAARGTLEGRVTEAGRPRAGALLELVRAGEDGGAALPMAGFGGASARSGGDGSYRVEGLVAGEYALRVTHPERAMPARFDVRVEEGANRLDLELPTAWVEGRVTSADGRSLAGARVSVEAPGDAGTSSRRPAPQAAGGGGGVETGPDGRFRLEGLRPGVALQVLARHPDHQPARSEPFELEEGGSRTDLVLALRPAGALDVRVVREDGSAPAFCRVVARFDGTSDVPVPDRRELVPEGGRVLLRGLAPGAWIVSADALSADPGTEGAQEAQPRRAEVVAGETGALELTLP
jgi:protocatechuate 3,4-dioxygenase beta subunit